MNTKSLVPALFQPLCKLKEDDSCPGRQQQLANIPMSQGHFFPLTRHVFPMWTRVVRPRLCQPGTFLSLGAATGCSSSARKGFVGFQQWRKGGQAVPKSSMCTGPGHRACRIGPSDVNKTHQGELLEKQSKTKPTKIKKQKQGELTALWWGLSAEAASQKLFFFFFCNCGGTLFLFFIIYQWDAAKWPPSALSFAFIYSLH